MKKSVAAMILAAGIAAMPMLASAGPMEDAIKARQGIMQIYAFNIGILAGMAKGAVDYDAQKAQDAADNLKAAATLKSGAMWPQGSDSEQLLEVKTRALPAIWSTYPAVVEKSKAMVAGATAMADNAGKGLDALRANMGKLGGACKGCHTDFRAEQ